MTMREFLSGEAFDCYTHFGAHPTRDGVRFRVYAPNARFVQLIGECNHWQGEEMYREEQGCWTVTLPQAWTGMLYKYKITGADGSVVDHNDPFGFFTQLRPDSASIVCDLSRFTFSDEEWMKQRDKNYNRPVSIYEVHLGSFVQNPDDPNGWYSYEALAPKLIAHCKEHGFTHLELLPISEHPSDNSWGYQTTGFFAPTSRYGTPIQLMSLVNQCHQQGIGVITDFVPVHFAIDAYGLHRFDGTPLYEYPDGDTGYSEWGSHNFNLAKGEARSLLQSAANYWLGVYHFDGIRMDAICNAIYWLGNPDRGVNDQGVKFIQQMNLGLNRLHPTCMLMAEDSSDFLKVTAPVEYDGLGFDYKWDMGWMNDTLNYFKLEPLARQYHYNDITFSMQYFYNELFLLPFSHDEVVHGKATIVQKMWGDNYEQKFAQCRALYGYMFAHPGKKLNFMGNEIAQFREWDETKEQDWSLLSYPMHDGFLRYFSRLNQLYRQLPALYDGEYNSACFRWLEVDAPDQSVFAFRRSAQGQTVAVVLNFCDVPWKDFPLGLEQACTLTPLISSSWQCWGGTEAEDTRPLASRPIPQKGFDHSVVLDLPAFSAQWFLVQPVKEEKGQENTSN